MEYEISHNKSDSLAYSVLKAYSIITKVLVFAESQTCSTKGINCSKFAEFEAYFLMQTQVVIYLERFSKNFKMIMQRKISRKYIVNPPSMILKYFSTDEKAKEEVGRN
ncbi:hypothetical protein DWZ43_10640 [Ruminococcus sp. AF32-2AC]|nr:hypothetical protein DWZ43_10640 [Ruminococcus sp. AF32-2AC]UWG26679.1 MAG: hypothetical protein [Bacteriophage sp.]